MTKTLSITQLETARKNPAAFATTFSLVSKGSGFGKSKYTDWKNAIYYFHKTNDLAKSLDYFENFYYKHFKDNRINSKDFEKFTKAIENYVEEYKKNNFTFVEAKKKIDLLLIKDKLGLSGQVPIINLNNNSGYSIYFFAKTSKDWDVELRFPIVQYYFSEKVYGVELSEIEVGIFALDVGKHLQKSYSKSEIKTALKELNSIGGVIASSL